MRKLIILRGNSGSGKSTIAKKLQNRLGQNTMLISQDEIRRNMLNVNDGEDTPALPLMKELLIYGSRHSEFVILECVMNRAWYKRLFELAVQLYGTEVYAYYFDLTFEETLKRHLTRSKCHEFGEEEMRRWWREKDFSDVLNETRITSEKNMESIVMDICSTIFNK